MKADTDQIKNITESIRSIYVDEYERPITSGTSLDKLEQEVAHLSLLINKEKTKKKGIIEHLSNCFSENVYNEFPISDDGDELDVLSMGFNTFMEELNAKTISRDYFDKIFNSVPNNVFVFDYEGDIDLLNIKNKQHLKIHKPSDRKIENYFSDDILNEIAVFKKSKNENVDFEIIINDKKNNSIYLACTLFKISFDNVNKVLFSSRDITPQKNEQIRILKATIEGQDNERKRLAHDLHDSLGQELNSIKMHLNSILNKDSSSESFKAIMEQIHGMLNDSIKSVQEISFDLMPSIIGNDSLSVAVEQLINKLNSIGHTIYYNNPKKAIKLKCKNDELFVYRIIQEFLNNSIKHSESKLIRVSLIERKTDITVNLRDLGKGFDFDKVKKSNGLNNIKQRLKTLEYNYYFKSEIGAGTELNFIITKEWKIN